MESEIKQQSGEYPLVSIIVITYNSAKYVIETLESAKAQTYQNIELIVSDDGSIDNTVEICREWIEANKERFVGTELITVEKNTGIPANCNRGVQAAQGEWVKLIAGDDLLLSNCIFDNINFISIVNFVGSIVFSVRQTFIEHDGEKKIIQRTPRTIFDDPALSSFDQYNLALRRVNCAINTVFMKRVVFDSINGYDEDIKLLEDTPFILKTLKEGWKYHYLDKDTVLYRLHDKSVFNKESEFLYNDWVFNAHIPMIKKYILPCISTVEKFSYFYSFTITALIRNTIFNKRNSYTRAIQYVLEYPFVLVQNIVKKRLIRQIARKYNLSQYL